MQTLRQNIRTNHAYLLWCYGVRDGTVPFPSIFGTAVLMTSMTHQPVQHADFKTEHKNKPCLPAVVLWCEGWDCPLPINLWDSSVDGLDDFINLYNMQTSRQNIRTNHAYLLWCQQARVGLFVHLRWSSVDGLNDFIHQRRVEAHQGLHQVHV